MLNKAHDFEKKEYAEKIYFALQDVVQRIYVDNKTSLTVTNQIKKVTEDYYIVNVDDVFEASVLEYYLKTEFKKVQLEVDFEYAIYNCASDEMVYGSYIGSGNKSEAQCENCFEKKADLIYYFAVRFPNLKYSYITSLQTYWIYTFILILVLIIYVYSIFMLLQQKKYSELQKDFINNMTHEFKTPLSSILIASKYAQTQEDILKNPKLTKYMHIIIQQSNKLNEHIERILTAAKSEGSWIRLDKKPTNLFIMLDLAKENALLKYKQKPTITIDCPADLNLICDEFHAYNMLFNIIDNAVKYSQPHSKVTVSVYKEKHWTVTVQDNGIGISTKHFKHIFDKFYRVPRVDSKEIEGFGIGLFYVKKIITLHQWQIKLKSVIPTGLSVSILIPEKDIQ
jgi:two-component system phosphate regulon sensor histidine kinase PhoR